jgi:hypothetical protein
MIPRWGLDTKKHWPSDRWSQNNLRINWGATGSPRSWRFKIRGPALQVRGVSNETVKYGLNSAGLGRDSDCSGKAQNQLYK